MSDLDGTDIYLVCHKKSIFHINVGTYPKHMSKSFHMSIGNEQNDAWTKSTSSHTSQVIAFYSSLCMNEMGYFKKCISLFLAKIQKIHMHTLISCACKHIIARMHTGATSNWLNLQQPTPGERSLKSIHGVFRGPPCLLNQPRVDQEVIAIATGKARGLIYNGHKEYCKCISVSYTITLALQTLTYNTSGPSCSPLICQCKAELCAQGCQIVGSTYQSVLEQDTQPKTAF